MVAAPDEDPGSDGRGHATIAVVEGMNVAQPEHDFGGNADNVTGTGVVQPGTYPPS
jgi:hypothetical protein